jgi:hypothetical protein
MVTPNTACPGARQSAVRTRRARGGRRHGPPGAGRIRRAPNGVARVREGIRVYLENLPQQEFNLAIETTMVGIGALHHQVMQFGWQPQGEAFGIRHDTIMVSF